MHLSHNKSLKVPGTDAAHVGHGLDAFVAGLQGFHPQPHIAVAFAEAVIFARVVVDLVLGFVVFAWVEGVLLLGGAGFDEVAQLRKCG